MANLVLYTFPVLTLQRSLNTRNSSEGHVMAQRPLIRWASGREQTPGYGALIRPRHSPIQSPRQADLDHKAHFSETGCGSQPSFDRSEEEVFRVDSVDLMPNPLTRDIGFKVGPVLLEVLAKHWFEGSKPDQDEERVKLRKDEILFDEAFTIVKVRAFLSFRISPGPYPQY